MPCANKYYTSQYAICAASFATEDDIPPDDDIIIVVMLMLNDINRMSRTWENVKKSKQ